MTNEKHKTQKNKYKIEIRYDETEWEKWNGSFRASDAKYVRICVQPLTD